MHLAVVLLTLLFCVLEAVPIATSTSLSTKDRVYLPSPRRQGLNPAIPHRAKSSLATYLLASTQTIQSIPTTSTTFQAPQTTPFVAASITQSPIKATSTEVANTPTATSGGVVGSWSSSGNYKARTIAYSPFHNDGSCKSTDEVLSDIAFLKNKGFYSVRTYDTGCGTLQNVGQAVSANGMKIIVGLWMDSAASVDPQVQAFISWGQGNKNYDLVDMLMIGMN
ncbi:putative beta-glucosidase btgE, partial [Neolecta irregularis DAH-3]